MINLNPMGAWVPVFCQTIETELLRLDNKPPFTSFQLATVSSSGFPNNRTMVYRGFLFGDKTTSVLTATTDRRSQKFKELEQNDKFEAVFWFERLKKQFRFRGHVRIIDDKHIPVLDLSRIQPQHVLDELTQLKKLRDQESHDDDEDDEEEDKHEKATTNIPTSHQSQLIAVRRINPTIESSASSVSDDDGLQMRAMRHSRASPAAPSTAPTSTTSIQQTPLPYALCSPALYQKIIQTTGDLSFTNLHDMQQFLYHPPTPAEWQEEISRQWKQMSRNLKRGFRKPPPSLPITEERSSTIDKIARGVDGKKDDVGLENFSVLALFVEHVDFLELDKDRRYIYEKDENHQWSEHEVCP